MEEGDLILCTVENVTNTVTQVRLPGGEEGTLVSSEIAPGRIKHMRHHVVPNKKIVCKILGNSNGHIQLSLRRVNSKEKKEVMQKFKQSQAVKVAFKQILGENLDKIKEKILKDFKDLDEFVDAAREDEKLIGKYIPKENQDGIKKVTEKKKKSSEMKQNIKIKCLENDGIKKLQKVLDINDKNISITYISAGKFKLKLRVDDFKTGKARMTELLDELGRKAKENKCEFSSTEEK